MNSPHSVKTGHTVKAEGTSDLEQVNVTGQLGGQAANHDSMEELESLMLRLEQVGEVGANTNDVRTERGGGAWLKRDLQYGEVELTKW